MPASRKSLLPRPARRLLSPTPLPHPVPPDDARGDVGIRQFSVAALLALGWLAVVLFAAAYHEPWRDEVRALSLALEGTSALDLFATLRNEGHPALWYLLLRGAHALIGSPVVLPALGIGVAAVGVWLFVRHAPFPLWQRALFVFGVYPAYEYSVMSRNYGLSMLFLFAWCALGARRAQRPLLAGTLLLLLANANAHSTVLVAALVTVWALQTWGPYARPTPSRRRAAGGMAIALAGGVLCYLQTRPDAASIFAGSGASAAAALVGHPPTLLVPGSFFQDAFMGTVGRVAIPGLGASLAAVLTTLVLVLVGLILARRPALLAGYLVAVTGLTALFAAVYPGFQRHQGLLLLFVLALLWMLREPAPEPTSRLRTPAWLTPVRERWLLGFLLVVQVIAAGGVIRRDVRRTMTSAPALGAWLNATPRYRDAILVGEPDYALESLPYYAPNRIYSLREQRFTAAPRWTRQNLRALTLLDLLATAERLRAMEGRPVLIAIAHPGGLAPREASRTYSYGYRFDWTAEQRARFLAATRPVAAFTGSWSDENYHLFELADGRGAP